ncbi:MAG TPA: zinc-binding alcohol dehydrogenase [Capsulimonadaceae bacterium]|jgi:alcohol dehydrogenase
MQTEAIVVREQGVARLETVALPEMSASRVRVRTVLSGVSCGTEGDSASGRAAYIKPPFITGYQAVGEVVEVGSEVASVSLGNLVYTTGGMLWSMPSLFGGSHAREIVTDETELFRLSPTVPSAPTAAYTTLAAVGLEGVARMHLVPGRVAVVFGLGMLGQLAGKFLQLRGLRVVGVNRAAWKRDEALRFGFDAVCAPDEAEIRATVASLGCGPAHFAVDLTGSQVIFDLALSILDPFGEISLLGYYPDPFLVSFDVCHGKQLTIHNPVGLGDQAPQVIRWTEEGRLNIETLIKHTIKPTDATEFYRDLIENHSKYLGVIIDWRDHH